MDKQADGIRYIEKVHEETQRYQRELLDENDRQRKTVARLQAQSIDLTEQVAILRRELASRERLDQALEENARRFSEEFAAIEAQNAYLANLYVASYQLHGTVNREGVLQVIKEIVANLIGSEDAAIYELTADGRTLTLVSSMGDEASRWPSIAVGIGTIGMAAAEKAVYVADGGAAGRDGVTAAIPLSVDGRVIGAIAVFRLLPQKHRLQDVDREMFDLLAVHAASALYCSTLHARASRCATE